MARFVSTLFCSLDGVAEVDPSWHFPYFDDNMAAAVTDDYSSAEVLLLGRVTYDSFAGAWPERESAGGEDAGFAAQLGDLRKIVITSAPREWSWRNTEAATDLTTAVSELRAQPGLGTVLIPGSLSIVRTLLDLGELDELRLLVHPVVAGTGERIFSAQGRRQPMQLLSSLAFPTGVIRLRYARGSLPGEAEYADAASRLGEATS